MRSASRTGIAAEIEFACQLVLFDAVAGLEQPANPLGDHVGDALAGDGRLLGMFHTWLPV
jgi:hypothetical protein